MKLFLIKIACLGQAFIEVRADSSSCGAIVHAMARYPQACAISARPVAAQRSCDQLGVCNCQPGCSRSCSHDTSRLPPTGFYSAPGRTEDEHVNATERHWPRAFDEAFRTPAWRDPISGPFVRPSPIRVALELAAATLLGLILVGVIL